MIRIFDFIVWKVLLFFQSDGNISETGEIRIEQQQHVYYILEWSWVVVNQYHPP